MRKAFYPDVPFHLIQSIRLIHALMESDYRVHVPPQHVDKFTRLQDVFGISFAVGLHGVQRLTALTISHAEPRTAVGAIERPLIFPQAILTHCREQWAAERDLRFSFAGLIHENRKAVLEGWLRRLHPYRSFTLLAQRNRIVHLKARLLRLLRKEETPRTEKVQVGDVMFWSSNRGRVFPGKSWDEEYCTLLSRSQFVLCPRGDFVWTYRFFEAAMCGAIPVVERACPAYQGFHFRTMDDPIDQLVWSPEEAENNFQLCRGRLTIPFEELRAELATLCAEH
jgi:hypothetical protein